MARPESKLEFDTDWKYSPAPESTDHIRIDPQYELFIGGKFVAPRERQYFDTINPAREKTLARGEIVRRKVERGRKRHLASE